MKLLKLTAAAFLFIVLISCSGSVSLYEFDYHLTPETIKAESNQISARIPKGWFSAEDNEENKIDLWLIKDDYSATISFIPVIFNDVEKERYSKSNLSGVVEYSKLSQKLAHTVNYIDLLRAEHFEIGDLKINTYQFAGRNAVNYRVAVFKWGNRFYECTAAVKPPQSPEKLNEIFSAQNAVLKSIKN